MMRRLSSGDPGFRDALAALTSVSAVSNEGVQEAVRSILGHVLRRGDDAVLEFTRRHRQSLRLGI